MELDNDERKENGEKIDKEVIRRRWRDLLVKKYIGNNFF